MTEAAPPIHASYTQIQGFWYSIDKKLNWRRNGFHWLIRLSMETLTGGLAHSIKRHSICEPTEDWEQDFLSWVVKMACVKPWGLISIFSCASRSGMMKSMIHISWMAIRIILISRSSMSMGIWAQRPFDADHNPPEQSSLYQPTSLPHIDANIHWRAGTSGPNLTITTISPRSMNGCLTICERLARKLYEVKVHWEIMFTNLNETDNFEISD